MKYRVLAAFGIPIVLTAALAHAQGDDDEQDKPFKPRAAHAAKQPADDADADADESPKAKAVETSPPVSAPTEIGPGADRPPIYGKRSDWFLMPYGYARLDVIEDSTQSFADGIEPNLIQRVGTYRGDHTRSLITAKDSRLGFFVGAPTYGSIKSAAQIEFDFYGLTPTDARRNDVIIFATPRLRLAFLKMETKVVDVIAGQYNDLFGWGSSYYPATVAYLGVPGQIYHRDPQLRIEKRVQLGNVEILAAVAAVRAGEGDSGIPDGQAGLKISYRGWMGAAMPGFGRPTLAPLSIGISGLYRHFAVPAFRPDPGSESVSTNGYGLSASFLLPIIPVKTLDDKSNALTLTVELSTGSGIADLYTGMDGGSRFPLLPNPSMASPALVYPSNVDPGLVTFDRNFELKTITWHAGVVNAQYYLPVGNGRIWVEALYSRIWSPNIKDLTPFTSFGAIFTKMEYIDGNVGIDITPSLVLALSFQTVKQTFGDVSAPTPVYGDIAGPTLGIPVVPGTGGVPATARNNRGQLSMALYF